MFDRLKEFLESVEAPSGEIVIDFDFEIIKVLKHITSIPVNISKRMSVVETLACYSFDRFEEGLEDKEN